MNIKSILQQFKNLDINGDSILSNEELASPMNTIWQNKTESDIDKNSFIICGLCVEHNQNELINDEASSFDLQNNSLLKQGERIGCIENNYCYYTNGVRLYFETIKQYEDLPNAPTPNTKSAQGVDITNLDLTDEQLLNLVIDDYTVMTPEQRAIFDKAKNNCNNMGLGIESLHQNGFKGYGNMALLDQEFCNHNSYSKNIISSTNLNGHPDGPSWHCAAMLSIMNKTSPESNIEHYCVTDENPLVMDENFAKAIEDIIKKNENLPDNQKIKTIIMGWGFYKSNPKYNEYIELCKKAVDNGIFICSNNTMELYGIEWFGTNRKPLEDVNSPSNYTMSNYMGSANDCKDIPKKYLDKFLFVPNQHLVISHIDGQSSQYEGDDGGACWANSVGALYNSFLSIKSDLKPQEFIELILNTADDFVIDNIYCGKILNANAAMESLKD